MIKSHLLYQLSYRGKAGRDSSELPIRFHFTARFFRHRFERLARLSFGRILDSGDLCPKAVAESARSVGEWRTFEKHLAGTSGEWLDTSLNRKGSSHGLMQSDVTSVSGLGYVSGMPGAVTTWPS